MASTPEMIGKDNPVANRVEIAAERKDYWGDFKYALRTLDTVAVSNPVEMQSWYGMGPAQVAAKKYELFRTGKGNHLYLNEQFAYAAEAFRDPENLTISLYRTRGNRQSSCGVFFVQVQNAALQSSVNLAVKAGRYYDPVRTGALDYYLNETAGKLCIDTLTPYGFLDDGKRVYSLTLLEAGLQSWDRHNWTGYAAEPRRHEDMMQQMEQLARKVACKDHDGILHGDLAVRNVGVRTLQGHVILFDWEQADLRPGYEVDAETRAGNSEKDLMQLVQSLSMPKDDPQTPGLDIFHGVSPDLRWSRFEELFWHEYCLTREAFCLSMTGNKPQQRLNEWHDEKLYIESYLRLVLEP